MSLVVIALPWWLLLYRLECLPQAVFTLDLVFGESAHSRKRSAAVGDRNCDHDFIGSGSVINSDFHAIEVTADESSIFVTERNIERHAQPAAFFRGRNQRRALAQNLSYWRAKLRVENGCGMLDLAIFAYRSGLAVAFDRWQQEFPEPRPRAR